MQIRSIRTRFEQYNANVNHSKEILTIRMQIWTIRTRFKAFERDSTIRMQIRNIRNRFKAIEYKFEPFEKDSNHSNANSKHSNEIRSNQLQIRRTFDQSLANSNHSKEILTIRMQIRSIRTRFEAIECKFKPFERDSICSSANSKHFNELRIKQNASN